MCTPHTTCLLGPTRLHNPNGTSIGSTIFAQITTESLGTTGHVLSPKNCSSAWGYLDHHLIRCSLGPAESKSQTASRSVQPFLQGRRTWTVQSYSPGCANVHPVYNTCFIWPTRTVSRSVQPFLHSSRQSVVGHARACPSPENYPFTLGDLDPHLIHGSLGPSESQLQTASRSVEPVCTAYGRESL